MAHPARAGAANDRGGLRLFGRCAWAGMMRRTIGDLVAMPLRGTIWCYQKLVSPLLGSNCRFEPSCSRYAEEALRVHGGFRGSWLTVRRITRCHPWGGSGYDPVPPLDDDVEAR